MSYLRKLYNKEITREDYYNSTFRDSLVIVGGQLLVYCPYETTHTIGMAVRKYCGHELAIIQALIEIGVVSNLGHIKSESIFQTGMQQLSNIDQLKEEHRLSILNKHYLELYSVFSSSSVSSSFTTLTPAFLRK